MLLAVEVLVIVLCTVTAVALIGYWISKSAAAEASHGWPDKNAAAQAGPRHKDKSA